jgi:hypothetical protein
MREETTIEEYLRGCNCSVITFTAGGWNLVLTEQGSGLNPGNTGIEGVMKLPNHFKIIRHSDDNDKLIEVQIREPLGEYDYKELFYLMRPTGTFIHKQKDD